MKLRHKEEDYFPVAKRLDRTDPLLPGMDSMVDQLTVEECAGFET